MPRSFQQIQRQIDKLQREANALRSKEVAGVVERIRAAIQHYGLSADDLFDGKSSKATRTRAPHAAGKQSTPPKASTRRPTPVKYRDENGNTWTGRGSQPRWLVAHLQSGRTIDEFAIKPK